MNFENRGTRDSFTIHALMALHRDELAEPLGALPPVEFAFSYGSGVFPQPGVQAMSEVIIAMCSQNHWILET